MVPFADPAARAQAAGRVANHLRAGGLIAYPTETVYGFGCALRARALAALGALKARDRDKPFLLLVRGRRDVEGLRWSSAARRLADAFWPGALTLALPAGSARLPAPVIGAEGAVAVRASPHPAVRALLDALGEPITSTSANAPGQPPAASAAGAARALETLGGMDVWVLDGGSLQPSPPSTIVDCSASRPRVLRVGAIPVERLREVVAEIDERS